MGTEEIRQLSNLIMAKDKTEGIENLAGGVEDFWFKDFYDRFPGKFKDSPDAKTLMNVSEIDLDALTHYYGQALSQQKYGTMPTLLAGLFNEARGTYRGNKVGGTVVDLINNISGLSPDISGEQEKYTNILSSLIEDPNFKVSDEDMVGLLQHGLGWTVDPPEREKYGQKK